MRFKYEETVKHTDAFGVETIANFLWYRHEPHAGRELAIVEPLDTEFQIDNRVIEQCKLFGKLGHHLTVFADHLAEFERVS